MQRKSKFLRLPIPEERGEKCECRCQSELARSLVPYPHSNSNSTRSLKTAANFYLNSAVHSPLCPSLTTIMEEERDNDSLAHTYAVPRLPTQYTVIPYSTPPLLLPSLTVSEWAKSAKRFIIACPLQAVIVPSSIPARIPFFPPFPLSLSDRRRAS